MDPRDHEFAQHFLTIVIPKIEVLLYMLSQGKNLEVAHHLLSSIEQARCSETRFSLQSLDFFDRKQTQDIITLINNAAVLLLCSKPSIAS